MPYSNEQMPKALDTGYRLAMNPDRVDRERQAQGIELGLRSGLEPDTALALEQELSRPAIDWQAFTREAPTVARVLAEDGRAMTVAAPFIGELWRQEKQLRAWNVRKPGEEAAQDRLGALSGTLGALYMGVRDVGRGLGTLHKDMVQQTQASLAGVDLDSVPGLDEESRNILRDINALDPASLDRDVLPVFDWMKTFDADVENASAGLRFVSHVSRALPTTGAAIVGGLAGGAPGAAALVGSIIYGQSLDRYRNDPTVTADEDELRMYALGNALIQGGLEAVGANRLLGVLNGFRPRGSWGKALKAWAGGMAREGATEAAQEFPDRFFLEKARGADLTDREDLRHLLDVFTSSDFLEEAGYAGLVGAAAGGLVTSPAMLAQRRALAAQQAGLLSMSELGRKHPTAYRALLERQVEAGNVDRDVFIPAAAIQGLFQEGDTAQDVSDFLERAGVAPADFEAARESGAAVAVPFERIADVLGDERGKALLEQLDLSPEQAGAAAAVTGEIYESVRRGELTLEEMPENAAALEQIREELGLDELALDERTVLRQGVVDAIVEATAGNADAYTAQQARAYADIIDATVATFAATHGLTYRGAFHRIAPDFVRADISEEEFDTATQRARETAGTPEAVTQDVLLASNRGRPARGTAAPRLTLEERDPLLALVRGRLDATSLKQDFPEAYRELLQVHGRGLFRSRGKGGTAIDELADEAVRAGLLSPGDDSSTLVEYLKRDRRELFQGAWHGSPHRFDRFSLDAIGTGEGAQAHGWGLYFAADRNVAEEYHNRLKEEGLAALYVNGRRYTVKEVEGGLAWRDERGIFVPEEENQHLTFLKQKADEGSIDNEYLQALKEWAVDENLTEEQRAILSRQLDEYQNAEVRKENHGQVFEVDIPDNDVLLDEETFLKDNPPIVQDAARTFLKELGMDDRRIRNIFDTWRGKDFYREVSQHLNDDMEASVWLNKHGVKGITYDGRQDGRCFVVFDDKAIQVLNTLYQSGEIQQQSPDEAFTSGTEAMDKVITQQIDVLDAMFRPDVGSISFYWGTPGTGPKLKKGYGISHLIARRNAEGQDGKAVAQKMPEVLAYGHISRRQNAPGGDRVELIS